MKFVFRRGDEYSPTRNNLVDKYNKINEAIDNVETLITDASSNVDCCGSMIETGTCNQICDRLAVIRDTVLIEMLNTLYFQQENIYTHTSAVLKEMRRLPVPRSLHNVGMLSIPLIVCEVESLLSFACMMDKECQLGILVLGYNKTTRMVIVRAIESNSLIEARLRDTFNLQIGYDSEEDMLYSSDYFECAIQPVFAGRIMRDKDGCVTIVEMQLIKEALCNVSFITHPETVPPIKTGCGSSIPVYPNNRVLAKNNIERMDLIDTPTGFVISEVRIESKSTGRKPVVIDSRTLPSLDGDSTKYALGWKPQGERCDVHVTLVPSIQNVFETSDYPIGMMYNKEDSTISIFLFFSPYVGMEFVPYREKLNLSDFWLTVSPAMLRYDRFTESATRDMVCKIPIKSTSWIVEPKTKYTYGVEIRFDSSKLTNHLDRFPSGVFKDKRLVYSIETAVGALQFIKKGDGNMSRLAIDQVQTKVFNSTAQVISFISGCNCDAADKVKPTISEILEGCDIAYPVDDIGKCYCKHKDDETLELGEYAAQPFDVLYPQTKSIFADRENGHIHCVIRLRKDLMDSRDVSYRINRDKLRDVEVYVYNRNATSHHAMVASVERLIDDTVVFRESVNRHEYQDLGIVVMVREDDINRDNTIRFVIPRGLVVIHEGNGYTRYVNSKFFIDYDATNGLPVRREYRTENGTGGLPGNDNELKEINIPLHDPQWAVRSANMILGPGPTSIIVCQLDILGRPGLDIDFNPSVKDIEIVCGSIGDPGLIVFNPKSVKVRKVLIPAFRNPSVTGLPTTTARYIFHMEAQPQIDAAMPSIYFNKVILRIPENDTIVSIEKFPLSGVGIGNGSDVMRGYLNMQTIEFPISTAKLH